MKVFFLQTTLLVFAIVLATSCKSVHPGRNNASITRSETLLDSIFKYYQVDKTNLFNENYPRKENETVTYLATQDTVTKVKAAYLWPTSGLFSGVNALLKATENSKYRTILNEKIVPGLQCYYDTTRKPSCFQSYITEAGHSNRFYDDNIWLAIDFLETYYLTGEKKYLEQSKELWQFLMSGCDDVLGGGLYWCEQKKESKNTCSNAPAAVLAFQLFEATQDSTYFKRGISIYQWTQAQLQDSDDVYFDNVKLNGSIGKEKYAYNTGQMLQAAALLYKLTQDSAYLQEAQQIARAGIDYFTEPYEASPDKSIRLFKNRGVWFVAVMMRGYVELYLQDKNPEYLHVFSDNLNLAWEKARHENGLINSDWRGRKQEKHKLLLNQAAMVEMYATLGYLNLK